MATAEEILQTMAEVPESAPVCVIDPETRTIIVPPEYQLFGVENDKRTERLYFQCPKIVGDNQDLSRDYQLFINYQNANGDPDAYHIEDMEVDGGNITFSWLLEENVTKYRGNIQFAFGAIIPGDEAEDPDKNRWNTTINTECTCLVGLKCTQQVAESNPDALVQIWAAIDELKAGGGGTGGTTNYNNLSNKPQLNGVTLEGNKTLDQVGVLAKNQGSNNSGKFLSVGSDGNVVPADAPSGGSVDPEQIKQAVNGYLEENPVSGMTAEQEQQLNQNTTDVADLKSALEQKADIFYTNESQLKDFGQTVTEERLMVVFGDSSNPMKDYEQILTSNEHLYICVRANQDYWNQGTGVQLNVLRGYAQSVKLIGDNFYTATSVKDDLGKYVFAYMTLNCAEILAAIKQNIEENSYNEVYGFQFKVAEDWKISSYNTPWYIGVTTVEPTQEMYERNFQTSDISEDFRNAVIMVTGGENNPDTEPDLSPLSGKYCLAIGDSYTYALAGESGALTTYNASLGMAGTLNYGIVSSTIRDRSSSDNGFAFKPMVCRVCHIPSKDSSGETLTGEEVPLDREDIGYITFMGGTNDSFTYPDSTGTDLCDGDQTHIYGGVNLILSKLVESYPDVPIIVILQPYYANNTSTEVADMSGNKNTVDVSTLNSKFMSMTTQVRKQRIVKEVAEFFSKAYKNIHVIDCCFNWFNPLKEEEYAAFWSQADNGLHLSGNGYNQIVNGERYDSISKKINEIFTVNTSNT